MSKIEKIVFRCSDPAAQCHFYTTILGMTQFEDGSVGYGGQQASLLFTKGGESYAPNANELYWKISLAVPDIELAHRQLSEQGIHVGTPQQFGDIAYLAHFRDPEGFAIELLDHWFKDNRPTNTQIDTNLFGGGAHLNLLTLRTTNIDNDLQSCVKLGMKLLSIMPVESRGFTLYFLAYTSDLPPSSDAYSVENREWVFQRTYTVLEIQHVHEQETITRTKNQEAGYVGAIISGIDCDISELLMSEKI